MRIMKKNLAWITPPEKDALLFHLAFSIATILGLVSPSPQPWIHIRMGLRIWALAIGYHVGIVWFALRRFHRDWLLMLRALVPISLLMVLPDGYLATGLKTIVFEDMHVGQIFKVSTFMSFMWTIPLFISTMVGRGLESRGFSIVRATIGAGLAGLLIFIGSEELLTRIPIWHAVEGSCTKVGNVALYVLFPEACLPMVAFLWCRYCLMESHNSSHIPLGLQLFAAFLIMSMYLGNIIVSFMIIDGHRNLV